MRASVLVATGMPEFRRVLAAVQQHDVGSFSHVHCTAEVSKLLLLWQRFEQADRVMLIGAANN